MSIYEQSGYLMKQDRKSKRNWKKRWFVLNDNTFTYFKDNSAGTPKGDLLLVGEATIADEAIITESVAGSFFSSKEMQLYLFKGKNTTDMSMML